MKGFFGLGLVFLVVGVVSQGVDAATPRGLSLRKGADSVRRLASELDVKAELLSLVTTLITDADRAVRIESQLDEQDDLAILLNQLSAAMASVVMNAVDDLEEQKPLSALLEMKSVKTAMKEMMVKLEPSPSKGMSLLLQALQAFQESAKVMDPLVIKLPDSGASTPEPQLPAGA